MTPNTVLNHITADKELRRDIDAIIQRLKSASGEGEDNWQNPRRSRERSIAITKLQEAVMWLGMDLKAINDENQPAEEEIEKLAETIFYEMQKDSPEGVHPWVPRGNSIMQDQARRLAREQVAIIANPYPSSKDPSTGAKIEPTADGLKL